MERAALAELVRELEALPPAASAEEIQNRVYEVGKHHAFADLRAWFQSLYEILFGPDARAAHGHVHRALSASRRRSS